MGEKALRANVEREEVGKETKTAQQKESRAQWRHGGERALLFREERERPNSFMADFAQDASKAEGRETQ